MDAEFITRIEAEMDLVTEHDAPYPDMSEMFAWVDGYRAALEWVLWAAQNRSVTQQER